MIAPTDSDKETMVLQYDSSKLSRFTCDNLKSIIFKDQMASFNASIAEFTTTHYPKKYRYILLAFIPSVITSVTAIILQALFAQGLYPYQPWYFAPVTFNLFFISSISATVLWCRAITRFHKRLESMMHEEVDKLPGLGWILKARLAKTLT
jgi:hypothetical protein